MATTGIYNKPGFDFSNQTRYFSLIHPRSLCSLSHRNAFLSSKGLPLPKATSTGTTIVGFLFKDGIVLGADTRATEGPIVADKNCEKVCMRHKEALSTHHAPLDPLLDRGDTMLRSRDGCRHRVHHRPHIFKLGTACAVYRAQAACRHRHDYAQADAFPVGSSPIPFEFALEMLLDTKDTSAQPSSSAA
jgi:hypothetical protein